MGDFVSTANMYCAEGMVSKLLWDRVLWELLLYMLLEHWCSGVTIRCTQLKCIVL